MYDRTTCALPGGQPALVAAVAAAVPSTVPVVAVLVHGGAFCIDNDTLESLDAILDSWYPGTSQCGVESTLFCYGGYGGVGGVGCVMCVRCLGVSWWPADRLCVVRAP